ncbi:UDP-glycosyltransferase UGT4-like [Chrysoperla carnea]|uniref:UDP-glycosyltransferase UGT4-like n=1 Tax=Chrysoperla carnea TaxID=189513 RepID=UPI001D094AF1|nr:UDP-glycosyltransferase UGT4-like [Chrysoperla carnea]
MCNGAKILFVVPSKSYSHQMYFRPILHELLNRGHEIVYLTTQPINQPTLINLTEINLESKRKLNIPDHKQLNMYTENQFPFLNYMKKMIETGIDIAFEHSTVQELVSNRTNYHFDIVVMEWIAIPYVAFSKLFNCPVVGMLSVMNTFLLDIDMGLPMPLLQSVDTLYAFSHPVKSITRRLYKVLVQLWYYPIRSESIAWEKKIAKKYFGLEEIEYMEARNKMKVCLVNQHPAFTGSVIQSLGVVNIAGLFYKTINPLPKNLQDFLDNATQGVIYLSFGTNVQTQSFPPEALKVLIEVLTNSPYKVLWKSNNDSSFKEYPNILAQKWFPQNDVLNHPNIKCFITQGGMQSIEEAIFAEVPLIPINVFSDQHFLAHRIHVLKIGIQQQLATLNKIELQDAIENVIKDPIYKENIKKLSSLYQDQRNPPLDTAVWWIEHTIRHNGTEYMKNPLKDYSIIEFYMLDVASGYNLVQRVR